MSESTGENTLEILYRISKKRRVKHNFNHNIDSLFFFTVFVCFWTLKRNGNCKLELINRY